jgi:hypothetical protein
MHLSRLPPVALARISHVMLPRDWGSNFTDCDAWIVLADPGLGGVYPIRPTAWYCPELAARRSPYAFAMDHRAAFWDNMLTAFRMWRQAGVVVTTDRLTAEDVVSFAGVSPDRLLALPQDFDVDSMGSAPPLPRQAKRLLIRMEPDSLHDVAAVLRGLRQYRLEGGALVPTIASLLPQDAWRRNSNMGDVVALPTPVRDLLEEMAQPGSECGGSERLIPPDRWARLLGRASAVWSPRLSGQGSHLNWPLRCGLPVLSADHPAARAAPGGTAMTFYHPGDPDLITDALHGFEADLAAGVPPAAASPAGAALLPAQAALIVDRLLEMVDA